MTFFIQTQRLDLWCPGKMTEKYTAPEQKNIHYGSENQSINLPAPISTSLCFFEPIFPQPSASFFLLVSNESFDAGTCSDRADLQCHPKSVSRRKKKL